VSSHPPPEPLPRAVVDNHTHLDISRDGREITLGDLGPALAAAAAVGVHRVVQIGCDLPSARFAVQAAQEYAGVVAGVALHPNEAPRLAAAGRLEAAYAEIAELATHPRVRVIGESGLDYFRTGPDGVAAQQDSFRWHIALARRLGKPLQVHDRDAHADVLRILAEQNAPTDTVMHCFSGDVAMARECVERGYVLSFSGTVTFKNSHDLRNALAVVPLEQVQVETDAPYLAPHPWRGKDNSPALLPQTVRVMAGVLGVSVAELCEVTSATAERLYGPW
jgi:TatD DNase family protein